MSGAPEEQEEETVWVGLFDTSLLLGQWQKTFTVRGAQVVVAEIALDAASVGYLRARIRAADFAALRLLGVDVWETEPPGAPGMFRTTWAKV
jgi:hypothetical protein